MKSSGRIINKTVCLLLPLLIISNAAGCFQKVRAEDLMDGIAPRNIAFSDIKEEQNEKATDFAARLFASSVKPGQNALVSPLSMLFALSMAANGAKGETLSQIESALGMTVSELNGYLHGYMKSLPNDEKTRLRAANSVWFTDDERFSINRDFLQLNADYFGADVYKAPFDGKTCGDINNWVKRETGKKIEKIIDEIPPSAVCYLINALAFEGEWTRFYEKSDVREGVFTKEDGVGQPAEFMFGTEYGFLADDTATGFLKYYKGGNYAFAALLPKNGVSLAKFIASLNGERLRRLLQNPENAVVRTAIPKFETNYQAETSEILKNMGIINAFDPEKADLSALGSSAEGNIYISRVLQKCFLSMGEKGTSAGAATAAEISMESALDADEIKEVYLDRSFVYMLIDCKNRLPFFIGAAAEIEK